MQMSNKKTTIVYMADDDRPKGGFCDRMRAIIWLYSVCKKHSFDFKINFTHPFKLQEYLKPNSFDWVYNQNEDAMRNSIKIANFPRATYIKRYDSDSLVFEKLSTEEAESLFIEYAQSYAKVLVYTNRWADEILRDYGKLFDELFCFSTELNDALQFYINQMNGQYVGAHFRFQFLLNDTDSEVNRLSSVLPVLHANEQKKLISACVKTIKNIHKSNPCRKVFVCSDSTKFTNFIKSLKYDYIYLIEGERKHCDERKEDMEKKYVLLLLLDYFLLVFAKKNYSVIKRNMYPSSFPYYASLHKKTPFIVLDYRITVLRRIVRNFKQKIMNLAKRVVRKALFLNKTN